MPPQIDKVINKDIIKEKDTLTSIQKEKAAAAAATPPALPAKREIFIKPKIEEVEQYCAERGNGIDAQHFFDYYEACGWQVGKGKKMKDWRAAVRTWENNGINNNKNGNTKNERMAAARADILAGIAEAEHRYRAAQGETRGVDTEDLFGEV